MRRTIAAATKAAPVLYQVAFQPGESEFTPPVPTDSAGGAAPPAGPGTALAAHTLTKTANTESAMSMVIGSLKKIQNAHNQWKVLL